MLCKRYRVCCVSQLRWTRAWCDDQEIINHDNCCYFPLRSISMFHFSNMIRDAYSNNWYLFGYYYTNIKCIKLKALYSNQKLIWKVFLCNIVHIFVRLYILYKIIFYLYCNNGKSCWFPILHFKLWSLNLLLCIQAASIRPKDSLHIFTNI